MRFLSIIRPGVLTGRQAACSGGGRYRNAARSVAASSMRSSGE